MIDPVPAAGFQFDRVGLIERRHLGGQGRGVVTNRG